jgi:hypothetical protein
MGLETLGPADTRSDWREHFVIAYKPVPAGYRGWRCGLDAAGDCRCGEPDGVNPSQVACPYGESKALDDLYNGPVIAP